MQGSPAPLARLQGLTHRYGRTIALDDVTLDLPRGKMLGVIGPDAVGKSTLLGLLAGVRRQQIGYLEVLGGELRRPANRRMVQPRIAYMPQGLGKALYKELSVRENIDFFARLHGRDNRHGAQRINRLLRATGLDPFQDRPAGKLSGGMKQKLGLCCSLIHEPEFLILDEPTTGVDPLSRRQFWDLIDELRRESGEMSVLVSTAYMEEAARFDWLAAMDDGCVLATGSPAELLERSGTENLEAAYVSFLPPEKRGAAFDGGPIAKRELDGGAPVIIARGLTKRFGAFTAVRDVSFEIRRGEIFGFLGSNGCGKTTTMKMLTGLLPPTEGDAEVFGRPIRHGGTVGREDVGFMSQSFTLYGELTVVENLRLHARLYHLEPDCARARMRELLLDFGLSEHADERTGKLPLGLKQRVSLACAVLHEPPMLILDEPTSGVDPVARDEFWKLLTRLAQNDGVTIFISTHFMNEAMRCDRISLMHAGRVLVCDTPETLAHEAASDSLEETFIRYISEADRSLAEPPAPAPETALDPVGRKRGHWLTRWLPYRMLAINRRELQEVIRDPVRLAFAFCGSMILMLLFAYGISIDTEGLTFAAFDQDRTPESRAYLASFEGSNIFIERPEVHSADDLHARMRSGDIALAIEIPRGFGRAGTAGEPTEVGAWMDGANTITASIVEGYVEGAHAAFLSDRAIREGMADLLVSQLSIEPRYRYNPSLRSLTSMAPAVPAILLMLFPAILMAVSLARERELGTITNFYVTPTTRVEYLLGKQLAYVIIGFANWLILTAMAVFLFDVPLKGSQGALALGAVTYVFASTGFGLVVASFARTQVAAVFATTILAMMPTVMFSGLTQPVSTLEAPARMIGQLWPTNYFMQMSLGAFNKSMDFVQLAPNIVILLVFAPAFLIFATLLLRKQEA
jgi:ribosome-dependent ATPase